MAEKRASGGDVVRQPASPGELVGKYQPFATLGEGGMAQVFLALARGPVGFNKLAVLKRMRMQLAKDEGLVAMFLDEARLAARLSHPNVIHTYEVGEHDGLYFIAMEYLDGQPLNRILAEVRRDGRKVSPAVWMRILCDALNGLHYAHDLKDYDGTPIEIVHRDISPHNVFVTYDGQVKVVDFGIAKAALSQAKTEVGVLKGKVAYMAPEQALGEKIDRRSDLFSIGVCLWEAVAGQRMYGQEPATATLHKLLNAVAPRLSTVVPDVDPKLEELVAKALARNPDDRFRTAHEMRDALEGWMRARSETVRQEEVGRLVSELFGSVRADVQRQIQAHMSAASAEPSGSGRISSQSNAIKWNPGASGELPAIDIKVTTGSSSSVRPAEAPAAPAKSAPPRVGALVATIAVTVVAVVALLFVPRLFGSKAPPGTTAATVAPQAPAAAVADSASPPSAPSSAPTATTEQAASNAAGAAAPTAPPPPTHALPSPGGRRGAHRPASSHEAPAAAATTAAATPAAAPGFLSFDTYPWTHVTEGGRPLGDTPLVAVPMSPGVHVLSLDNPDSGIHRTTTVTIVSGQTVRQRLGLK